MKSGEKLALIIMIILCSCIFILGIVLYNEITRIESDKKEIKNIEEHIESQILL